MTRRAWRRAGGIAASVLVVVALGCGRASDRQPQPVAAGAQDPQASAQPAAPAAPVSPSAPAKGALPTLPPVQQRAPELFDANGCSRQAPAPAGQAQGPAGCASTAAQVDAGAAAEAPDGSRVLAGFVGKHWSTVPTGKVAVLEATISTRAGSNGEWAALGLVRNETESLVAVASVRAELVGGDGGVVEIVTADAQVGPLRAGEPAPFVLAAKSTKSTDVASVRWSADATPSSAAAESEDPGPAGSLTSPDPDSRTVELQTFWTRQPGDPRRIDLPSYRDTSAVDGALPLVTFGSVTNRGGSDIGHPSVVLAWLDRAGRVAAVRVVRAAINAGPVAVLAPQSAADFVASVNAAEAAAIPADQQVTPMIWGLGT